jgi:hypothetical protein
MIVRKAFKWKKVTVFFTAKHGVYRLKDLKIEGKNLSYQSINKWKNWFETHTELKDLTTMFPMTYQNICNSCRKGMVSVVMPNEWQIKGKCFQE